MKTLLSMSGSKWYFWKFKFDHGIDYVMKKVAEIESFEDLERLIIENINYETDRFALFRDGIEPRYENPQNKYAFTWINTRDDNAYLRFFYMCWKMRFFNYSFVNGIYCTPQKISTWTSECETQKFRNELAKENYHSKIFSIYQINYEVKLQRRWTIAFFDNEKFEIPLRQRFLFDPRTYLTDLLEKIIKVIYDQFHFTESEKGIILTPSNLPEDEWRIPDKENRFVYSAVKASLKEANRILPRFALNVAHVLYPRIPTIFLAFVYYINGYLHLGVYLSGKLRRRNALQLREEDESAFDMSCHVAYKIKEILTSILSQNERIRVAVTNAVPSEGIDFDDRGYEYCSRNGNIYSSF